MQLLSKLKYVGVSIEDLIEIYCLYIRSLLEYSSVVFHSSLTDLQTKQLEAVQTTSLRVILCENFMSLSAARPGNVRPLSFEHAQIRKMHSIQCQMPFTQEALRLISTQL